MTPLPEPTALAHALIIQFSASCPGWVSERVKLI